MGAGWFAAALNAHRLRRPGEGVVALVFVGVAHRVIPPAVTGFELDGSLDIGQEGMADHLHRLAVQGKLPPVGCLLEILSLGPAASLLTRLPVLVTAPRPDPRRFQLSLAQPLAQSRP